MSVFKQGVEGQVKWFSNRKGFGFLAATDGTLEEEIFVHQTGIVTQGHSFRTLQENAVVKFDIEKEDTTGKLKAVNVTNVDGTPIVPPPRQSRANPNRARSGSAKKSDVGGAEGEEGPKQESAASGASEEMTESGDAKDVSPESGAGDSKNNRSRNKKRNNSRRNNKENKEKESNYKNNEATGNEKEELSGTAAEGNDNVGDNNNARNRPPRDPPFHTIFKEEVRSKIEQDRGLALGTRTTIDVALAPHARIKLGQGGYAGLCLQTAVIGEGSYTADEDGTISFNWDRALKCEEGEWKTYDPDALMKTFSLLDEHVGPVQSNETASTLWGADKPDPREAFEANGFSMRRVNLTRPSGYRGGGGYRRHKQRNNSQRNSGTNNKSNASGGGDGGGGVEGAI